MSTQRVGLPERGAPPAMRALRSAWGRGVVGPEGGHLAVYERCRGGLGQPEEGVRSCSHASPNPANPCPRDGMPSAASLPWRAPLACAQPRSRVSQPRMRGAKTSMGNQWAYSARVPGLHPAPSRIRFGRARAGLRRPSSKQAPASSSAGSPGGHAPPAATGCVEGGMVSTAANLARCPEERQGWKPGFPRRIRGRMLDAC